MDEAKSSHENDDIGEKEVEFHDVFDEFQFYDCSESLSDSDADVSSSDSVVTPDSTPSPEKSAAANLRRRRFSSRNESPKSLSSSVSFETNYVSSKSREALLRFSEKLKEKEEENSKFLPKSEKIDEIELNLSSGEVKNGEVQGLNDENNENSMVSYTTNERNEEYYEENSNFLIVLAGLVVKAIGFQFNLLFSFLTFPIWVVYTSYIFVMDPFGFVRRGRKYLVKNAMRIFGFFFGNVSSFVNEWFKEHKSLLKLGLKFGWGLLWSVYVCVVLVALLVSAFVVGGILMNVVVENPIRIEENLNFDFTEKSPTAFVPIIGCPGPDCGVECSENFGGMRVIPLDHKVQVTVSLRLPESDYNRNLGIFQVRVDFLGPDGKALASFRHPCMLQYKSEPVRLLLTFFKVAPLLTGYTSESQELNVKFRGFTEGGRPTSCLRVTIEQRAQFAPGAGIPEIYAASLTLESKQPLLKRIVWYWRITLFIWASMTTFTVELLFALLCCNSIIIPRVRLGSATNGGPQNNGPI